jgi:hypothetical protein
MRSRRSSSTTSPGSYKPTWWAVLTVALAVVAVTFAHLGHDTTGQLGSQISSSAPVANDLRSIPTSPLNGLRVPPQDNAPQSSLRHSAIPTSNSPAPSLSPRTQEPREVATTTTTTTTTVLEGSRTFPGYLNYPDNVSSFLSLPNMAGPFVVSASWLSGAPLALTVSCASTTQSSAGTYETKVSIPAVQGPCTVRLNEESPTNSPVSYTISVTDSSSP